MCEGVKTQNSPENVWGKLDGSLVNLKGIPYESKQYAFCRWIMGNLINTMVSFGKWSIDFGKQICCQERFVVENKSYRVIKLLAEGGFSFVYLVQDNNGRKFAAKRIVAQNEKQVNAVKWEINVHRILENGNINIMPLLGADSKVIEGYRTQFTLLFPVYDSTLIDILLKHASNGTELSESVCIDWFLQICEAVTELHKLDPPLAHRDIKPHNVLFSATMTPVLMDFGSVANARVDIHNRQQRVKLHEEAAENSSMAYRAPELWDAMTDENCVVDERTDCWSLGCLLYAMLFGQGYSPFECTFATNKPIMSKEKSSKIALAIPKDCSYLSVIGKVKYPEYHSRSSEMTEIINWILSQDTIHRPTLPVIIDRIRGMKNQYINTV